MNYSRMDGKQNASKAQNCDLQGTQTDISAEQALMLMQVSFLSILTGTFP